MKLVYVFLKATFWLAPSIRHIKLNVDTGTDPGPPGEMTLYTRLGKEYSRKAKNFDQSEVTFSACCHDNAHKEKRNEK